MNAKEIRDIPQDLLVRLGEERNKAPEGEELKPDYIQACFDSVNHILLAEIGAQLSEANNKQLTLRDQFAIAALDSMLTKGNRTLDGAASAAYKIADYMLEARK